MIPQPGFRPAWLALAVALTACSGANPASGPDDAGSTEPPTWYPDDAGNVGVPDLRVPASELAFGQVGFLPGAAISATLRIVAFNAGAEVLRVHGWKLQATSEASSADEVEVLPPAGWDGGIDLAPVAGKNVLELTVRLTPASVGYKRWQLRLTSNDPDEPEVVVELSALVVPVPDCELTFVKDLHFALTPPDYRDASVTITNVGTERTQWCQLTGIQIAPSSDPAMAILGGPIPERLLAPSESLQVTVRVPAQSDPSRELIGQLEFEINSVTTPHLAVSFWATVIEPECLVAAPADVDFGSVGVGCSSTRTVSLYNVCATEIVLTGLTVASASDSVFLLAQAPAIPAEGMTMAPGQPVTFQVNYEPFDPGTDVGSVQMGWKGLTETRTATVGLSGTGESGTCEP